MAKVYQGIVKARVIDVRFALSGKVASVSKYMGDTVKKWDVLATLDRKILQTELDRELADYEKARAAFEIFAQKNPEQTSDLDKYLKAEKQAALNASVKSVELAKARLDQSSLLSPVDGIILDDGGITPGVYTTPAGSNIKIIDTSSYYFEISIEQKDLPDFEKSRQATIKIDNSKITLKSPTTQILSDGKKFTVKISITDSNMLLGMTGKASF